MITSKQPMTRKPHQEWLIRIALVGVALMLMGNRPQCGSGLAPSLACNDFAQTVPRGGCVELNNPCRTNGSWRTFDEFDLCLAAEGLFVETDRPPTGNTDELPVHRLCSMPDVANLIDDPSNYIYIKGNDRREDSGEGVIFVTIEDEAPPPEPQLTACFTVTPDPSTIAVGEFTFDGGCSTPGPAGNPLAYYWLFSNANFTDFRPCDPNGSFPACLNFPNDPGADNPSVIFFKEGVGGFTAELTVVDTVTLESNTTLTSF